MKKTTLFLVMMFITWFTGFAQGNEENCKVSFSYPEGIEKFFTAVTLNGMELDFKDGLTVNKGETLRLYYNESCWEYAEITVNDKEIDAYSSCRVKIDGDTKIAVVEAEEAPMFPVSIDIDNPDNVTVYRGDSETFNTYKDILTLKAGDNVVMIPDYDPYITIKSKDGNTIKSIMLNNEDFPLYDDYECEMDLYENDSVKIITEDESEDNGMIKLSLDIDSAERVKVAVNGEYLENLISGTNISEINPWSNLVIEANEGVLLTSVTDAKGEEIPITNMKSASIFISDEASKVSYTITTQVESEISFIFEVDQSDKIQVCDRNYTPIEIHNGINNLSIAPGNLPLIIGPAVYGEGIYSVTMDGVEIPYEYGYVVSPQEGSRIVVTAAFPEKDCTLTFTAADGIADFFTAITVNGESRDLEEEVTVKCGDNVALFYNASCWLNDSENPLVVTINSEPTSWFGPGYSFIVKDDTEINIAQATQAQMISVSVSIDYPQNVIVYRDSEYYHDVITLEAGENIVSLPEENARLVVVTFDDECAIEGIAVNGRPQKLDAPNYTEICDLENGDKVEIFSKGHLSSIDEIAEETITDVYSITGIRVLKNADRDDLMKLPAGIYIFNFKKIIIK
ncbi:MAG: hypothetical protein K2H76_06265 [Muribaculaceae bacterium]|nr:hypothetical protein [Muribaculaceae bacterium]